MTYMFLNENKERKKKQMEEIGASSLKQGPLVPTVLVVGQMFFLSAV